MDVVALARELVSIPSITGQEGRVAAFVAERLESDGWRVSRQPIPPLANTEMDAPRLNVLGVFGDDPPKVVLATHLDTVPPFIPLREDDARLYGRGTCDAKGIFAAQWVAADRLSKKGLVGIGLLGLVGEETDSIGAKSVGAILPSARWIIDGEPTDLVMASGAKGILSLRLRARGIAGHSAYPEVGRSAIHALVPALARLLGAELPSEVPFGPTTVNVGVLKCGVAPNVIADDAAADVMIRLGTEARTVRERVKNLLGPDIEVEVISESEPHRIHVPEGHHGEIVRFGSDVPYLSRIATTLLVGPGSIHRAHTLDECIEKSALYAAVDLYINLVELLLDR